MAIITEQTQAPAAPNNLTEAAAGSVAIPVNLTEEAAGSVAIPVDLTEEAAGSVAIPVNLTEEAAGSVAIPVDLTEESAGSVAIPVNLTEEAAGSVAIPVNLTEQAASALPRTICPLVSMDFSNQNYAQCGEARTFDDLFTYARNSSATFINRRKNCGKYEYFLDTDYVGNVENLTIYSEQFDNAAWTKGQSTVVANNSKGVGSQMMDRLQEDATATTVHVANGTPTTVTSGATVTISIDAKADQRKWILLYEIESADGYHFNVKDGVIGTKFGSALYASIKPLGNGVFRCSVTLTVPSTVATMACYLADSDSGSSYSGDGVSGLFIDRAQLTESDKDLPYVATTTIAVTEAFTESLRIEYDPATGDKLGALIEGASTNMFLRSEELDNASWTKTSSTITTNDTEAPDETTSADKLTASSTASLSPRINQGVTSVATSVYSSSFYVKASEASFVQIFYGTGEVTNNPRANFDVVDGTLGTVDTEITATIKDVGGGWYRISSKVIAATTSLTVSVLLVKLGTDTRAQSNSWTSGEGVYIWGGQTDGGHHFPLSYIRTTSGTVSRVKDDLSGSLAMEYGTLSVEASVFGTSTLNQFIVSIGSDINNYIGALAKDLTSVVRMQSVVAGSTQVDSQDTNTYLSNIKTAFTFNINDFSAYSNGVLYNPDTIGLLPVIDSMIFGADHNNSNNMYGHIRSARIYDEILTAQEISLI